MANDSDPPQSNELDQNSTLGKYKIQRKVGSGGMGAVYLAIDQQLKRTVALKVLPRDKASNKVLVRRFKAEGQAGAQLEHLNIVAVYESGEIDGYLYLAMEFVEGIDAYELLRKRGILPVKRSLDIIKQVTLALQHAHERQVVHRDIKPSNLMIRERDGLVKLADMGLARIIEDENESAITKAGTTVGTVDYMSPEQGRDSKAADIRSDIYSLGCTWFHLICGKAPYPDGDLMNKLRAHALQPVPDPRMWNESIPPGIVAVLQRMMAKKPEDRYQTPDQLLADLNSPALLRGDLSAEQLTLLGAAHAQDDEEDGTDDVDDHLPVQSMSPGKRKKPRGSSGTKPVRPAASSRSADPDYAAADDDDQESRSPSPVSKSTAKKAAGREALPARTASSSEVAASDEGRSRGSKSNKSERVLPARMDKLSMPEVPTSTIDPNHLKLGLLAIAILLGVGGVVYTIRQYTGDPVSNTGDNPYASGNVSIPPTSVASNNGSPPEGEKVPAGNNDPRVEVISPASEAGNGGKTGPVTESPSNSALPKVEIDQTPFAGEIAYSADGTGPLPQWIWQSRSPAASVTEIVIRRGAHREGEFRSVGEAITHLHGDVVIEFADAGPHEIPALFLKQAHRWTFRAADGVSPMLVLQSPEPLKVQTGTIVLDGVHLIALPDHAKAVVQVESGTLVLKHASITHLGIHSTEVVLAGAGARVLSEFGLIRAAGGSAVKLQGERSSCVAGQSMFVSPRGQAISVHSQDGVSDNRLVTLVSSACLAGDSAVMFAHQGKTPPNCGLNLLRSIVAYVPGQSADGVGVRFSGWPKATDALDRPRPSAVTWAAEKSAFVGWPHWAKLEFADQSEPVDVRDEDAWRAFWRQTTPSGSLIPEGSQLQAVMDAGAMAAASVVQNGLATIQSQLEGIGPRWADLPSPPMSILQSVFAFGECPRVNVVANSPDASPALRFDLKGPTLGRFLNSPECPDGATVIAFGAGLRTIDPFVLRQKRIELIFEQADGATLTLQPGYKTEPGAMKPAAWIAVEDGQLTISNGFFRLISSTTRSYPDRILQMSGGIVALRECRFEVGDSAWPMIDVLSSEGHAPPQFLVDRTLLVGPKNLIRVATAESLIEVRESILASLSGVAISLESTSAGSQCFLNRATLSAGRAAYQIQPLEPKGALNLFSRETLFQGGGVMALETDSSSVHWWGVENAYASQMKTYLITRGSGGLQDFQRDWSEGWGAGHELLAVQGGNLVVLPDPPGKVVDVEPASFQLHSDCAAAKAGDQGTGIGAPISRVGPRRQTSPPGQKPPSKGAAPGTAPPKKNIPNF